MATYDNIKLEKGLYTTGKSFTEALESLDPSENYAGTALEGLDAYQRQLKRFNIKVSGRGCDTVEKFFQTTDSAALFPEYVSRAVWQGMTENDLLPQLVATVTEINGMDYRSLKTETSDGNGLSVVAETAAIPATTITNKDSLVTLHKRGRMLVASYEALRYHKLDLFTVMLRQIGAYIAKAQLQDAITVLMGSAANNDAITETSAATAGTLTYADLVAFWNSFDPFNLNAIIASPSMAAAMLNLSELRDAAAGLSFHGTGKLVTPFGAQVVKSSGVASGKLIGLDKSCALEQVTAGGVLTDFDKLIDRQLERAAITGVCGFAKIYNDAAKVLTI